MSRGETRAVGAVGHAVVEGERERQQQPRHDLALAHHRLLARARHAEDGHLGVVDDRDRAGAAERADIRDRERAPAQVVERRLALAHALGERGRARGPTSSSGFLSTSRMTGTIRPRSVATATPRWW